MRRRLYSPQPRRYLHDRFLDDVAKVVQLLRCDRQRRRNREDVAAYSDPDASAFQCVGEASADADFGRKRTFGFAVGDEFEALDEADAAGVADYFVSVFHVGESVGELGTSFAGVLDEVFAFDDLEVLEAGGDSAGMGGVGVHVAPGLFGSAGEGVADAAVGDAAAEGEVSAGDAFGEGDDVGLGVDDFGAEPLAETSEAGDDLVEDEDDAVAVADLSDHWPVVFGRHDTTQRLRDRLTDDGRYRVRPLANNRLLDGERGELTALLGRRGVEFAAVEMRRGNVYRARGLGLVVGAREAGVLAEPHRAIRRAVIRPAAGDHLVSAFFAHPHVVGLGEFESRFVGLRTALTEEGPRQVARRQICDLSRQLNRRRCHAGVDVGAQIRDLLVNRLGYLFTTMSGVAEIHPRDSVDVAVAVDVPDVDTLAAFDDQRAAFFAEHGMVVHADEYVVEGGLPEFGGTFDGAGGTQLQIACLWSLRCV